MRKIYFIFLLSLLHLGLNAQMPRLYTSGDGLSNSHINDVYQDSRGFIWVSTEHGMGYFDGMKFMNFHNHRDDKESLASDLVLTVFEDSRSTYWVGSSMALQTFNLEDNTFSTFKTYNINGERTYPHIAHIIESKTTGYIFAATSGHGIVVIDPETNVENREMSQTLSALVPAIYIYYLFEDSEGRLWVATENDGLIVIDLNYNFIVKHLWEPSIAHIGDEILIEQIVEDAESGNIIIGSFNYGILIWEKESGKIRRAKGKSAIESRVKSLLFDSSGQIWVGTEDSGISSFSLKTEETKPVNISNSPIDLTTCKAHALLEDNQGNLWIGIYQKGLLVIPKSMYGFEYYGFNPTKGGANVACVTSIIKDESNKLWVGTDGGGIFIVDKNGGESNFTSKNSELPNNSVMAMEEDSEGTIWIATFSGGLCSFSQKNGFKEYPLEVELSGNKVMSLAYDKQNDVLYAGTYGAGLNEIFLKEKRIETGVYKGITNWIGSLMIDSNNNIWIGTFDGAHCFDTKTKRERPYNLGEIVTTERIYAFAESSDGTIWIGSGNGLAAYSPKKDTTTLYTMNDGLPSNVVNAILEGDDGNLWISTHYGLARFNPMDSSFTKYYVYDGLQENEFRLGAAYRDNDGKLYFGGINGLTAFYPKQVERYHHPAPNLNFTGMTVFNKPVHYNKELGSGNILDKSITEATSVRLKNSENVFSFEFTVLEFTNPHKIIYGYMMEGFDSEWKYTNSDNRKATYTNLPAGKYTFKVKASYDGAPEGFAVDKSLKITILPPLYRSTTAYIIYTVVLLILLVYLAYILKSKKEQQELKLAAERDEALKDAKLKMFANISHEIRTPLTLVITPLNALRESEENPELKDMYNLIYRNALRVLRLVNQLLDIRRIDTGQMKMRFTKTDMIFFVRDIVQSFDYVAEAKKIDINLDIESQELEVWIDQSNFDKVMFNLLSNAFKFTPQEGEIDIKISTHNNNYNSGIASNVKQYMELSVFNSGESILDTDIEHVFDRYYQGGTSSSGASGTGIGLNLSKMLIELHHGTISVRNVGDSSGVIFVVRLPLGNDHLSESDLAHIAKHKDLYTPILPSTEATIDGRIDPEEYITETIEESDSTQKSKHNIIIVEDDSQLREYLRKELSDTYNVKVAKSGNSGWRMVSRTLPDLVVTDLVMPDGDGLELCKKIKTGPNTNHIPVIVLTSQGDEATLQESVDTAADRFLTKPVSMSLLKSSIEQAIGVREMLKIKLQTDIDYGYEDLHMDSADTKLVERVVEIIHKNIENPEFSVENLSSEVGMSRVHLNRKLKENINMSPSHLIRTIRLKQAAYLLLNSQVNISEVAYKVGFSTHSYFTNSFHNFYGMTPKEFVAKYIDCEDEEVLKKLFQ